MPHPLKELLLEPTDKLPSPLFRNTYEAACYIANQGEEYTEAKTVAALLTQVFQGRRPCGKNLERALLLAIRSRLTERGIRPSNQWDDNLQAALQGSIPKQAGRRPGVAERMRRSVRTSESLLITLPAGVESAKVLISHPIWPALISALALFEGPRECPAIPVSIWVSSQQEGDLFYRTLFSNAAGITSGNPAGKPFSPRLTASHIADLVDRDLLQVLIAPKEVCSMVSVVILRTTSAFNVFLVYGRGILNECSEIGDEYYRQSAFSELEAGEMPRVAWALLSKELVEEAETALR